MFLVELAKLTRFEHALMLAFAVFIAETIVFGSIPIFTPVIILSLLIPILSEMGSFALNDYFDIETDRKNKKKDRPLVNGKISPKFALLFSIICLIGSTAYAFIISNTIFAIVLIFNLAAILYNWKMKDLPLVGNIYIALTMALPFIFGNFVVSNSLTTMAIVLALLGFVAGLAREIIKSVQDMEGDRKARGSKTLPIVIGKKPAMAIAIILYLLFIPLSAAPFLFGLKFNLIAASLIVLADIIIVFICYKTTNNKLKFARDMSLVSFLLGMSGLFLASIL
ncbi:Digeranylgeranylglyceryl phosphate synthase [Candidatus Bilamarchaeum dharawalense]|uniref:Digeranylgeranylglyceryl phosphate synthase n=1 Tax=Candidatus Bilamarchaeum dharawalense TaxID=2885759 RepID=A0A5E4LTG6_9ARCH|nr:Digeranylgeranylglyceryl phosphate synthase [Candidatus Bilamarchaeum dharawalense]